MNNTKSRLRDFSLCIKATKKIFFAFLNKVSNSNGFSEIFGGAECEIIYCVNCEILLPLVAMWNEIRLLTFAKQIFHSEAISLGKAKFHSPQANFVEKRPAHKWVGLFSWCTFRDSTLARTARSVIRRENSSTGRVFYTAPTSNPFGVCKRKTPRKVVFPFYGAPSGIRTRDPLIKSQLLYQLS